MPNSTMIAVPIRVELLDEALDRAQRARDGGADLVEWRVDSLEDLPVEDGARWVRKLVAESPLPCIVTCRAAEEGGEFEGSEDHRLALYEAALGIGGKHGDRKADLSGTARAARYIDVEHSTLERSPAFRERLFAAMARQRSATDRPTSLILSFHDTKGRPADLLRKLSAMRAVEEAAVLKVAITARSLRDNLELFDLLAEADRPMIAIAMGQFGLMSRVLAGKFGALLTFASLSRESTTAPGQPTIRELLDLYRFRSTGRETRVYGVVGWPVEHSISPHVHNAGFEAVGHDGVYLPMPIGAHETDDEATYASFKATVEAMAGSRLGLHGLSATIPFKTHLYRWCSRTPDGSTNEAIGAVNTLMDEYDALESGGRPSWPLWFTLNTDAVAIAELLASRLGHLSGRRIAILGAGGVARAAAWACVSRGADVIVHNRTLSRAEGLLEGMSAYLNSGEHGTLTARDLADLDTRCDAYINCTPLGMIGGPAPPSPDESPIPPEALARLPEHAIIFDTVYTPRETPLLRAARKAGLGTIDGLAMFIEQAAAQFTCWTGKPAPLELFRRVAEETLAERESPGA